jgi:hypothetical protein
MVKSKTLLPVSVLLFGLVFSSILAVQTVDAKVERISFSGTRIVPPNGGDPGISWVVGVTRHVRNAFNVREEVTGNILVDGLISRVINLNSVADGSVQLWGTFVLDVDGVEGSWEGSWTGKVIPGVSKVHCYIGHGVGELEGYTIKYTLEDDLTQPSPPIISGIIINPHGD